MKDQGAKLALELYDRIGAQHEEIRGEGKIDNEVLSRLFKFLPRDLHGKVVADMGGGSGAFSEFALSRHARKAILVDVSDRMLLFARNRKRQRHLRNLEIRKADLTVSKIKSHSVDIIFSIYSLPHVFDIGKAFKEFNRILKKGGFVFVASDFYAVKRKDLIGTKTSYLIGKIKLFGFAHTKADYLKVLRDNDFLVKEFFVVKNAKGLRIDPNYRYKKLMRIYTFGAYIKR
jgi:ubiquinone/menaquinone biosynthesis C-methylase UbiE